MKIFNTTGVCVPDKHYMVDLKSRMEQIKAMVDAGQYFTIHRARQYGKTTTLTALEEYLKNEYLVISLDFQELGDASFANEYEFSKAFATIFTDVFNEHGIDDSFCREKTKKLLHIAEDKKEQITLLGLFRILREICTASTKSIVLMIDEIDSATNNQVFLDFLAQLRSLYLKREKKSNTKTFHSVILAGVTDVKNLKKKIRPDEPHKFNSPWNIATDFNINMSFSADEIAEMLLEYEADHNTGMDVQEIAQVIYDYTNGYPYLVSKICQSLDTELISNGEFIDFRKTWSIEGISEAVRIILMQENTLFESLMGKVLDHPELSAALQRILFAGETIAFNPYDISISDAKMYGFVFNDNGVVRIANRIFEMLLYNFYLTTEAMQNTPLYKDGSKEKDCFIEGGHLNMERILEHFIVSFQDIYGSQYEKFDEGEDRRRFLLYVRPIINGTGNYYIEAQTRNNERMDLVIDYHGERHVIEIRLSQSHWL